MKLNELTKEQRASIEADELGMNLIKSIINYNTLEDRLKECKIGADFRGIISMLKQEIKRIIKRIDYEMEWINRELTGHIQILSETVEDEFDRGYYGCTENIKRDFQIRIRKLKKQKNLYELMEQLE